MTEQGVSRHDSPERESLGDETQASRSSASGEAHDADKNAVRRELDWMKEFVRSHGWQDIKSGDWFAALLGHALVQYAKKVDWEYFEEKYPGLPRDAVVDARAKLACRYATIEAVATASAYNGTLAATIGSAGGASPVTLPAAGITFATDLLFITQLQLRLAYDIAMLYRIPMDLDDPDDMWKLIKVAFVIKAGESARSAAAKGVPPLLRPLIRKIFSGPVLAAGRSLPIIGKYLLQRNIVKFAIPAIGIPLSGGMNYWTTKVAGRHAKFVFRGEARIRENARRLMEETTHPRELLWVTWLVMSADGKVHENEKILLHYLIDFAKYVHGVEDRALRETIEIRAAHVWNMVRECEGDRADLCQAAVTAAEVDGKLNKDEQRLLTQLEALCL